MIVETNVPLGTRYFVSPKCRSAPAHSQLVSIGLVFLAVLLVAGERSAVAATTTLAINPDYYSVPENGTLNVSAAKGLLQNDYVSSGTLVATSYYQPNHGTLSVSIDGSFSYTPNAGFTGTDSFMYYAGNGTTNGLSTNTITVYHPAPVAAPDVYTVEAGGSLSVPAPGILANDRATAGKLIATSFAQSTNGTLGLSIDGSLTYTPNPGYFGTDTCSYYMSDGSASGNSTVSIVVTAVAPVANNYYFTLRAGQTLTTVATNGLLVNDSNLQGKLIATSFSQPAHGALTVSMDGSFSYTPNPGFTGTDTFYYYIGNGVLTASALVTFTVVDNPPVANPDFYEVSPIGATGSSGALTVAATNGVLVNDFDPDGDPVIVTSYLSPAHGTLNMSSDGSFTYTPHVRFVGTDVATYYISDGALTTSSTLTIRVGNGALALNPNYYSVPENGALNVPAAEGLLLNDYTSSGTLVATSYYQPNHGTLSVSIDGSFSYTPNAGFTGTDSFMYYAGNGTTNGLSTNTITVYHPAPVAAPDVYTVEAGGSLSVPAPGILANDRATAGKLIATSFAQSTNGTLGLSIDGSLTYTPNPGYFGTDTCSYYMSDGSASGNSTVSIVVTAVAPVANNYYFTLRAGQTLTTVATNGLLVNDSNLQGKLIATSFSQPAHGALTVSMDGSFSYTPNPGFTGTDTFYYYIGNGVLTANALVTFTVVDNPPVANPDFYQVTQNGTLTVSPGNGVLENDFDPDSDPIRANSFSKPAHGSLVMSVDGSFSYSPDSGFTGIDSAFYYMGDGALTANSELFFLVTPIPGGEVLGLTPTKGTVNLSLVGTPGTKYDVQRATTLTGPWNSLSTLLAPTNGLFNFTDPLPPQPNAFYRLHENDF